ncbi:MAG: ATP-binding protein involved in chromosome partitioning [Saprospiraceae bacterium]|jgi:ATP-binding protein involved in chromosome partitioning
MSLDKSNIEASLKLFIDPHNGKSLVDNKAISDIRIDGGKVAVDVVLGYPANSYHTQLQNELSELVSKLPGVENVIVSVTSDINSHAVQEGTKPIEGVKNIIAVASGKGGVGKSTVSSNLALALAAEGASVGILDADIYGPSQPRMFGLSGQPTSDGKSLQPMISYRIQTMSIGYLIEEDTPMIWRGPMVTQALEQLLRDTRWNDLDYLIIDLPPGTGDIQLTLAQKVPVTGSVIVTTPQDIALIDARKAVKMFEKVEIPILGIVENMSTHVCTNCGHEEHIFGSGGGEEMAKDYDIELLGNIPLDGAIRQHADQGKPTVVADPDGSVAQSYKAIARKTAARLADRKKDFSAAFPNIVIQQN